MEIPDKLISRLGQPTRTGDWAVWEQETGVSESVVLWKPGMRSAVNRSTGERYFAEAVAPRQLELAPTIPEVEFGPITSTPIYQYLRANRGLTDDEIVEHARQFPYESDIPNRAVFPITEDGKVVQWQGRALYDDTRPKYLSGATDKGWTPTHRTAWGLDRIRPGQPVFVCEGIFDALYFPTGVAVLGSQLHETQAVKILDRRPGEIVLCPDMDKEGDGCFDYRTDKEGWEWGFAQLCDLAIRVELPMGYEDFGEMVAQGERYEVE